MGTGRGRGRARLRRLAAPVGFVGMALSGAAWACVPQPNLVTLQPHSSGPQGTEVTVNGVGFDPGSAEVRWNSVDGPLLGEGDGPTFSIPVKIPTATEGLYTVVVLSRQPGGAIGNTGTAAFQVIDPPGRLPDIERPPASAEATSTRVAAGPTSLASVARTVLTLAAGAGLLTLGMVLGTLLAGRRGE